MIISWLENKTLLQERKNLVGLTLLAGQTQELTMTKSFSRPMLTSDLMYQKGQPKLTILKLMRQFSQEPLMLMENGQILSDGLTMEKMMKEFYERHSNKIFKNKIP